MSPRTKHRKKDNRQGQKDGVRTIFFFSSRRRHTRCYRDWNSDVCSSDLPIHLTDDGAFVDGSLGARNPLALAVVEAIGVLDWPREDVRVLSLGCTSQHLDVAWNKRLSFGTSYWSARIADVFMKAQSSSAISMAHTLIGSENVFRISPDTTTRGFTLDGVRHMPALEALGREEAVRLLEDLATVFFRSPAEHFIPCHALEDDRQPPLPFPP